MKWWFMGSGEFAAQCLKCLNKKLNIEIVVTGPSKRSGRGLKNRVTPVELLARELEKTVYVSDNVSRDEVLLDKLKSSCPHAIAVIDFGQKVLDPYLTLPRYGCFNVHPSLLPKYRGAAPVQRAIMDGVSQSGVTVFKLIKQMDAGPVLCQEAVDISQDITSGELLSILACKGSHLLNVGVKFLLEEEISFQEQDSKLATYASKIDKSEALLTWNSDAMKLHNKIRAFNPSPGAFVLLGNRRLKIWRTTPCVSAGEPGLIVGTRDGYPVIATADGGLVLMEVQPEGKRKQDAREWFRGSRLKEGEKFA